MKVVRKSYIHFLGLIIGKLGQYASNQIIRHPGCASDVDSNVHSPLWWSVRNLIMSIVLHTIPAILDSSLLAYSLFFGDRCSTAISHIRARWSNVINFISRVRVFWFHAFYEIAHHRQSEFGNDCPLERQPTSQYGINYVGHWTGLHAWRHSDNGAWSAPLNWSFWHVDIFMVSELLSVSIIKE